MPDKNEEVEREVVIELGDWLQLKNESALDDQCNGVRHKAGEILTQYTEGKTMPIQEVKRKIRNSDNIIELEEKIL